MTAASLTDLAALVPDPPLTDSHGRVIHDLRVSITDRCNYKCVYCRTGEVGAQYPELGIDEYLRLIRTLCGPRHHQSPAYGRRAAVAPRSGGTCAGTGRAAHAPKGEPLDLALTTNGHLLESLAAPLKAAGLNRVTVSMDAVDAATFERITRIEGSFPKVLASIRAARDAGLTPREDQLRAAARL